MRSGTSGISETMTPIVAERTFPKITARGVAKGLAGTPNARTADAPIGATMAALSIGIKINPAE
ncbi:hypothetical protein AAJCM20276_03290 [Acetobacter aceti]|uniref:Uncharacterized protein n=1 Tax=Acetobacter aceti TaxID=435 RepID=A0A6S6PGG6_ACEAC|nr:hypothetical protein AAJCM20276_03290 [Acetobacter aceti]